MELIFLTWARKLQSYLVIFQLGCQKENPTNVIAKKYLDRGNLKLDFVKWAEVWPSVEANRSGIKMYGLGLVYIRGQTYNCLNEKWLLSDIIVPYSVFMISQLKPHSLYFEFVCNWSWTFLPSRSVIKAQRFDYVHKWQPGRIPF